MLSFPRLQTRGKVSLTQTWTKSRNDRGPDAAAVSSSNLFNAPKNGTVRSAPFEVFLYIENEYRVRP